MKKLIMLVCILGLLAFGATAIADQCVVNEGAYIAHSKREADQLYNYIWTGKWNIPRALYQAGKLSKAKTSLKVTPIEADDKLVKFKKDSWTLTMFTKNCYTSKLKTTPAKKVPVKVNFTISDSVGICDDYITELFPGSKIGNACLTHDLGDSWFIVWNMACPITLVDPSSIVSQSFTGPRRTGAACEVSKTTGYIVYLAVSARELIK